MAIWCKNDAAGYLSLQTDINYVIFIVFPLQQWLQGRASCYVIRTLSVLFHDISISIQLWTYSYIFRQPETIDVFE